MKAIPLVRSNSILPVIKFLEGQGIPTEPFIREAKLPIYLTDEPEGLISLYHGFNFLERVAYKEDIPHLGILAAQQTTLPNFGMFGKIVFQSVSLHDLINTIASLITANYNSGVQIWITYQDDQVWFNHQHLNCAKIKNQQTNYYFSLTYLKVIQLIMGTQWYPSEIHFQTDELPGLTDFELLSHTKVQFNQPNNTIIFPKSLLMSPLKHRFNGNGNIHNRQQTYEILQSSAPAINFTPSLRQLINEHLKGGYLDIKSAAEAAGMSTRSLQRRLAEEGLTYSRLVDQVRFDLAINLLQDSSLQLNDIASELGYTKPANFTRSFKRWVGVSPRQFRHFSL